ncbi:hypothetical protein O181_115413 [Austropuccinia psidii MF-1]|uniref:Uncharacterized protein n=1 Tax=Austropuccinia psidii MF-1 TaxID=1389203 RepID=A0A9Q3K6I5_9BASI|nr:hypothetical protein [Austropuccinia psidii MF-1]
MDSIFGSKPNFTPTEIYYSQDVDSVDKDNDNGLLAAIPRFNPMEVPIDPQIEKMLDAELEQFENIEDEVVSATSSKHMINYVQTESPYGISYHHLKDHPLPSAIFLQAQMLIKEVVIG